MRWIFVVLCVVFLSSCSEKKPSYDSFESTAVKGCTIPSDDCGKTDHSECLLNNSPCSTKTVTD